MFLLELCCIAPLIIVASIIFIGIPLEFLSKVGDHRLAKIDREKRAKRKAKRK